MTTLRSDSELAFVGRRTELALLAELLSQAIQGEPRTVLAAGPAGVGKTALVRRFLSVHPDLHTIWVSADESESLLALGVAEQILKRVTTDAIDLRATATRPVDHLSAGIELLDALAGLVTEGPVVLVVDDLQWIDLPSLQAIVFMLRRLVAERVLTVLTCRQYGSESLPDVLSRAVDGVGGVRLELAGLNEEDLLELAPMIGRPSLGPGAARRLRAHTDGNPLYVRALLDELPREILASTDRDMIPAPKSYAALVMERRNACPAESQRLVDAASVIGLGFSLSQAAALGDVVDLAAAVDAAVAVGLLVAPLGEVRFAHPLVQAAIYHALAPGRRARLHQRAASLARSETEVLRHRISGSLGESPQLAEEVGSFASREAQRGAWASAADAFMSAVRLDPGSSRREQFLTGGVECLLLSGDGPSAAELREQIELCVPCAQRDYVLGLLATVSGERAAGRTLFEQAWQTCVLPVDGPVAGKVAQQLGMVALNEGRGEAALEWTNRSLSGETAAPEKGVARAIRSLAFAELGRIPEGLEAIGPLPSQPGDYQAEDMGALLGRGLLRMFGDDLAWAVADLSLADRVGRRLGPLYMRIIALFYLADTEYRLGRWDQALIHAELATSLGHDANEVWTLGLSHSVASFAASARGEWRRSEGHISGATLAAETLGDPANHIWLGVARARLAHARRDPKALLAATEPVARLPMPDGLHEPGIQPWGLLQSEALVLVGRLGEAGRLLGSLAERAREVGHCSAMLTSCRVAGLLEAASGSPGRSFDAFDEGLALAVEATPSPFELALLELDYGSTLRRAGRRKTAVKLLQSALHRFGELGAVPYLERCERELAGAGLNPVKRSTSFRNLLTPQELAVATLVAEGRSTGLVLVVRGPDSCGREAEGEGEEEFGAG